MNIAIIGAGFTGLSSAFSLQSKGHKVSVFERDSVPGGLAVGFHIKKWEWTLEKHYHHWFANDESVLDLAKKIDYSVLLRRPKTCVYYDNQIYQLDSPSKVLTFPKLSLTDRVRMAFTLGLLRFNPYWKLLEGMKTSDTLPSLMGRASYEALWEPQMKNKFGSYEKDISLAWFWARVKKRTAKLAYPAGGFLQFAVDLQEKLEKKNVLFHYDTHVEQISETDGKLTLQTSKKNGKKVYKNTFDKILVTLPGFAFSKMAPQLPDDYKKSLTSLNSLGAINLVLRLKQPFLPDNTYWLSICEKNSPIMAIVEHTNFMDKVHYNNEHIIYLGNYLAHDHKYFSYSPEKLLKEYDPFLQKIRKNYQDSLIGIHKFEAPFAQPIIPPNYSKHVPPITTPLKNVFLANMQQVYPWDRGTNYAVEMGEKAAEIISHTS